MDLTNMMQTSKTVVNLIYLFILVNPSIGPERMYFIWKRNKILREYQKPNIKTLRVLYVDLRKELGC